MEAGRSAVLAYEAALNQVDFAEPTTFDGLYSTVTGDQLVFEKEFLTDFAEKGWTSTGTSEFSLLEPSTDSPFTTSGSFIACLDLRDRRYFNRDGVEWVNTGASGFQPQHITVSSEDSGTTWLVSKISPREGEPKCE